MQWGIRLLVTRSSRLLELEEVRSAIGHFDPRTLTYRWKHPDPRVDALFRVSKQAGGGQRFVQIAEAVEAVLPDVIGKPLKLNVSAAIPAVLLGVGFPLNALKGVPMLARCAGLIAHMSEELETPIGFALSYQATREERYTGPVPAGFVPVQKID